MTVILDAGHGGVDPGALGKTGTKTIYESHLNYDLSLLVTSELKALGAQVILTRGGRDQTVRLTARGALTGIPVLERLAAGGGSQSVAAREALTAMRAVVADRTGRETDVLHRSGFGIFRGYGASPALVRALDMERPFVDTIFVSIHHNSSTSSRQHGLSVIYASNSAVATSESRMRKINPEQPSYPSYPRYNDGARAALAKAIYASTLAAVPELKSSMSQPVYANNYAVLRDQNLTSVLFETAYLSNAKDLAMATNPNYQRRIAAGLADGIWRYLSGG